jgi:HK97 family phage portal protein
MTSLQIPAVYACVRIIAEGVASLPLNVYEQVQPRGKRPASELDLHDLLHDQPNPEMSSFVFRETLQGHICLWGNGFAEIQRDGANRVVAFWPRAPHKTHAVRHPDTREVFYVTSDGMPAGQQRAIKAEDMLHIPALSLDGLVGMSPIEQARQAMGLAIAAEKFGAQFFGNGSRPGGVLTHPGKLSQLAQDNLRRMWQEAQGGENQNRVAVLESGISWTAIGVPPEQAQFLETRKFQKSEIASIYRVPPHMIADLERSTHSNIEQQSLEFVMYCLTPWLVRWEQELKRKLFVDGRPHGHPTLGRSAGRVFFPQFSVNGLTRGDFKTRYEGYAIGRQWGWLSGNDVREQEDLNPMPGDQGDIYLVPMNMTDAETVKPLAQLDIKNAKGGN